MLSSTLLIARNTIGLNINAEDFEVEGSMDINNFSEYTNGTIFIIDANFISIDNDNLLDTDKDKFFGTGLYLSNTFQGMEGLSLGFGARFVYLEEYMAIPIMAKAAYALMISDVISAASISTAVMYSPSALSFSDAENYFELRAEAAIEVINAISIYGGYRKIELDYIDHSSETFNSSFYGGLKMSF